MCWEVLDYGASGNGVIERTVLDTAGSPYSQIKTWTTNPYTNSNYTAYVRMGNLAGIAIVPDTASFGGEYIPDKQGACRRLDEGKKGYGVFGDVLTVKGCIDSHRQREGMSLLPTA